MKVMVCFVLLLSGTYAFGKDDPAIWKRGIRYPNDKYEKCHTERIEFPKERSVERKKECGFCVFITYAEWKDYEENISIVTVPEGDIGEKDITVKIEAREYINGLLTICAYNYGEYGCLF